MDSIEREAQSSAIRTTSDCSIVRGLVYGIDNEHIHRSFCRLESKSELLLKSRAKQGRGTQNDKVTVRQLVEELFKQYDIDGRKTKDRRRAPMEAAFWLHSLANRRHWMLPGHDSRVRWRTQRPEGMKMGGWKTDSVFRGYNIVDEKDLHEAASALDRKRDRSQFSHNLPAQEKQLESSDRQDATIQ